MNKQLSIAVLRTKLTDLKQSFADYGECCEDESVSKEDLENLYEILFKNLDYLYEMIQRVGSRLQEDQWKIWDAIYEHQGFGHLPKITSVEQFKRVIDILQLSEEVEVMKKTVYASNGEPSKLLIELPIK